MKTDRKTISKRRILVYGATGGIGKAIALYYHEKGAHVIAGGRNGDTLRELSAHCGFVSDPFTAGLSDYRDLASAAAELCANGNLPDTLIIASGSDRRTPFRNLSDDDISRETESNFTGIVRLLHVMLPLIQQNGGGRVALVSGYGDGRLSFTGHALNAACRSALYTLMEALAREFPQISFLYYCPPAVDTESERPFFPLWKRLGVRIIQPQVLAADLERALARGRRWHMYGSVLERLAVRLHAGVPRLADALYFNNMNREIEKYLKEMESVQ